MDNVRSNSRVRSGSGWILCVVLAVTWLGADHVAAQPCDPALQPPKGERYGYRRRGDRCEGIYAKEVALATLNIVSLTSIYQSFDPGGGNDIELGWLAPSAGPVHLRANSLRRRLYYRMDATSDADDRVWTWPSDVVAALELDASSLGVVAWTYLADPERTPPLYLPLRVGSAPKPAVGSYTVIFVPGRELIEAYIHLKALASDGNEPVSILAGKALGYGYYPADRGVRFRLPELPATGIYQLEIGAQMVGGGATATSIDFYHTDGL